MWLLVHNGAAAGDLAQLLPELAALAQFAADLARRMEDAGVDGPRGTLALHRRLHAALDGVTRPQLEQVRGDLVALEDWLRGLGRRLADLERVKRALETRR